MTNMPPPPALRESEWRDAPVAAPPPATPAPGLSTEVKAAGVAWLVSAGLIGYLALVQWNAGDLLSILDTMSVQLGLPSADSGGEFRRLAILNGGQAVLTLALGVRILRHPSAGLMGWSIAWAVLSVAAGAFQLGSLVNPFFLGSIIAAVVAGWYSWQLRERLF